MIQGFYYLNESSTTTKFVTTKVVLNSHSPFSLLIAFYKPGFLATFTCFILVNMFNS